MSRMSRDDIIFKQVDEYFQKNQDKWDLVNSIINHQKPVSLRFIEFFLNLVKNSQGNTMFGSKTSEEILVSYNRTLKAFSKSRFDLFCRNKKTAFSLTSSSKAKVVVLNTTLAQLVFFWWLSSNGIIDVILSEKHRLASLKKQANSKKNSSKVTQMP